MTFAYDEGEATMTDAVGDSSSFFVNQNGLLAKESTPAATSPQPA